MTKPVDSPIMKEAIKRFLRSQMAVKGVEYKELVKRLEHYGIHQSESTLRTKINKGVMGAQLFIYIQFALGLKQIPIQQLKDICDDIKIEINGPE